MISECIVAAAATQLQCFCLTKAQPVINTTEQMSVMRSESLALVGMYTEVCERFAGLIHINSSASDGFCECTAQKAPS